MDLNLRERDFILTYSDSPFLVFLTNCPLKTMQGRTFYLCLLSAGVYLIRCSWCAHRCSWCAHQCSWAAGLFLMKNKQPEISAAVTAAKPVLAVCILVFALLSATTGFPTSMLIHQISRFFSQKCNILE